MTTLHDRLADLADDAPPGGSDPGLWQRARRYHRRRRAGTALIAIVVVLALAGLGTLDWWRARPAPVPADSTPALPSKLWKPNVWLPGTDDAGPLGQLAAVMPAFRGSWTGRTDGLVAVSAATGEYRFLDLPDLAPHVDVALAPDGRHLAFWYTGETRESPNSESGPVVGVAVYDTTTGEVVRHAVPTDHGLEGEDLVWADADRLVFSYWHYAGGDADDEMAQSSGTDWSGLLLWAPGEGDSVTELGRGGAVESSTGHGQLLLSGERWSWVDVDRPGDRVRFEMPEVGLMYVAAVDDRGTRIAWPTGTRNPNTLSTAPIREGRVEGTAVPGNGRTYRALAWLDAHRVAVVQLAGRGYVKRALRVVDVRTGAREEVLRYPQRGGQPLLATDLLGVPSVDRPKPPDPVSPRKIAAGMGAVALGGVVALLWWRRRVRA